MAMVSCSKNEILPTPEEMATPISFGTYVGKSPVTKADDKDETVLETMKDVNYAGIGVFAYWCESTDKWTNANTTNFMTNTQVTWQDEKWNYKSVADTKYWSTTDSDKYSFFAYAPWVTGTTMSNGKISVSSNDDTDVLIAVQTVDSPRSTYKDNNKISFAFKHAKAQLAVKATLGADETAR